MEKFCEKLEFFQQLESSSSSTTTSNDNNKSNVLSFKRSSSSSLCTLPESKIQFNKFSSTNDLTNHNEKFANERCYEINRLTGLLENQLQKQNQCQNRWLPSGAVKLFPLKQQQNDELIRSYDYGNGEEYSFFDDDNDSFTSDDSNDQPFGLDLQ